MEPLSEDRFDEWDQFVPKAKGGSLFHTGWFLRAFGQSPQIRVLRNGQGNIKAGLVLTTSRFLATSAVRRTPWTCYNGPLILPSEGGTDRTRMGQEKQLMLEALSLAPRLGMYDYIMAPDWTDMMPFLWNGFDTLVGYVYQIPPAPPEQWQAAISKTQRRELRQGKKEMAEQGCTIEVNGSAEEFYELVEGTARRCGFRIPCSRPQFLKWWQVMRERDAATLYVFWDGQHLALEGIVVVRDWTCTYSVIPGTRGGRRTGAGCYAQRLLMERIILDSHERGLIFDFAGSVLPGVELYFRSWGGRCRAVFRAVRIRCPWAYAAWSLHRYWTRHRRGAGPLKASNKGQSDV